MMLLTVEEILALQEKVISQTGRQLWAAGSGPPGVCRLQRGQFLWRCGGLPQPGGKGGEAGFCHYREPCLCGWKQADRHAGDAADPAAEWAHFNRYTQAELVDLGLGTADGSLGYEEILAWIISHLDTKNPAG